MPVLTPETDQVLDAAKIAVGAYSPVEGFMDRATVDGVLADLTLPDSLAWPIPIFLSPPGKEAAGVIERLRPGDEVGLRDSDGRFFGVLRFQEKFPLDRSAIARSVYGTTDTRHPNVAALRSTGDTAIAGPVDLLESPRWPFPADELTPAQTRRLFARRGWSNVAGFQTRNLPHAGHEHLHRLTLERDDIDGLLIHPVIGPLKPGDYRPEVVLEAYRAVLREYYPVGRVALATLTIAMRYAGPRASLFFAIVRKNFGCSHYIVGRDQAGVGGFYEPYACHAIFDAHPVGIVPLRFREQAYCRSCGQMASERSCPHPEAVRTATSQTRVRAALREGSPLPLEILRPEVVSILRRTVALEGELGGPVVGPAPGDPGEALAEIAERSGAV